MAVNLGFKVLPFDFAVCPALSRLWTVWRGWAGERPAPAWTDVDLSDVPTDLLPMMTILDRLDDGRHRYRFWGTGLVELYGAEITGQILEESLGQVFRRVTVEQLGHVYECGSPMLFEAALEKTSGASLVKYNIRLPIMDTPGRITKVMTASVMERGDLPVYENAQEEWAADRAFAE